MIKNITIKDVASFDGIIGVTFAPTSINFIYGSNGSGKTTISNVIANHNNFSNCNLNWGLATPLQILVYNKNFVDKNFGQSSELKGIFTLGQGSKDEIENIAANKAEIEKKNIIVLDYKGSLEKEKSKLEEIERTFEENCWIIHKKYETIFLKAFDGNRGSKIKFKEKVIAEFTSNKQPIIPFLELENKANAILNSDAIKAPVVKEFILPNVSIIEENPVFQTRIIGKDDIDIAKMILKLNNSDWVKQGINYFEINNEFCPFCQQTTPQSFKKQLDEYFDESYTQQIQSLKSAINKYDLECKTLLNTTSSYIVLNSQFIDLNTLKGLQELISSKYQKNLLTLEKKLNEPTIKIELDSIVEHLYKIKEIIDNSILKTKEHNNLIDNISTEKKLLISKIWAFVINELKINYDTYKSGKDAITKATQSIEAKLQSTESEIRTHTLAIQLSESKITSIKPTIDAINRILSSFGFTNFSLAEAKIPGYYKIIRENGDDAKNTLSEGEKTFITFLYFYHLTSGSFETSKITTDKVLVIDDPISSLDSSVLFIVSNLVRQLISDCKKGKSNVKQVFVLTHNVYFHKEVTFKTQSYQTKEESFWIVRKVGNNSAIQKYSENPIKTSYDLLWQEIRDTTKINKLTAPNTLRRIVECYFKILGKIKNDDLLDKFEGEDKIIGNALLSWINDGSHIINDDMFISTDGETIEKYLRVFKKIFEVENQIEHYNMMMKVN